MIIQLNRRDGDDHISTWLFDRDGGPGMIYPHDDHSTATGGTRHSPALRHSTERRRGQRFIDAYAHAV